MAAQNNYRASQISNEQMQQVFNNQQAFVNQLQQQAAGQGPSAAQEMYKQAAAQQAGQANALAASQQGNINAGLATRNAQMMGAQANQQAAGNAAVMRNQEQLQAQGMLGQNLAQQVSQRTASDQINAGIEQKNAEAANNMFSTVFGGLMKGASAAGAAVLSDERAKENIHAGDKDIKSFLDALQAKSYTYKDASQPGASPGAHTSVMAQDLEKSSVGKQMVMETPQGKMVDYAKGLPAILAAQAQLNKRLEALEKPKKMAEGGQAEEKNPLLEGMSAMGDAISSGQGIGEGVASLGNIGAAMYKRFAPQEPVVMQNPNQAPIITDTVIAKPMGQSFAAQEIARMAQGGMTTKQIVAKHGAVVPGQAKAKGDSEKNDTVKALLSPGEIVIPRSIVQSKDAPAKAAAFVEAVLRGKSGKQAKKEIK